MAYMKFEFVLETMTDDVEFETLQAKSRVYKSLGFTRVFDFRYVESLPDRPYDSDTSYAESE